MHEKKRMEDELVKARAAGNQKRARLMQRALWALYGKVEKRLNPRMIQELLELYNSIDVVPTHYDYPQFYQY